MITGGGAWGVEGFKVTAKNIEECEADIFTVSAKYLQECCKGLAVPVSTGERVP